MAQHLGNNILLLSLHLTILALHLLILLLLLLRTRMDQVLLSTLICNKLALADMWVDPDLVLKLSTLLALLMLESTSGVQAWVELALGLHVGKLAALVLAICAVAAERCRWVTEWTALVGAVWEELAVRLGGVSLPLCRRWVAARTLAVHARGSKGADIGDVNGCARWCCWGLMCELALWVCAVKVELADVIS